ncbi:hypothetical protein CEP54_012354 [Fusarium duplospermum]|uniref:Uncharacterized protein n=1 Tax=Fusarium duplospermum TaxID=1325734 RepID=A0A428P971_9HYPO|nr:hypothetical protein CEP54_012354 [Fusarium duplospermum]
MNEEDYFNLVRAINCILGIDRQGNSESRVEVHSGSRVIELADFYIDFPDAEMSMNPEDIIWPIKLEGPISFDDLVQKYEVAVKNLQKYLRNIDALSDHLARETVVTFPTGSESATELTERLAKEKQHANKLIHAIQEVLAKAKEQAEEEAVTNSMGEMSLSEDS